MGNEDKEAFASDTMYDCLENIDDIVEKRVNYEYTKELNKGGQGAKARANAVKKNAQKMYKATKDSVDSNKPSPALSKFLNFIES